MKNYFEKTKNNINNYVYFFINCDIIVSTDNKLTILIHYSALKNILKTRSQMQGFMDKLFMIRRK